MQATGMLVVFAGITLGANAALAQDIPLEEHFAQASHTGVCPEGFEQLSPACMAPSHARDGAVGAATNGQAAWIDNPAGRGLDASGSYVEAYGMIFSMDRDRTTARSVVGGSGDFLE